MAAGPADDRPLAARLADRIRTYGPIPVSEFVEAALYDPVEGFYNTGGRAGRRGDFITAPEVGPLFGAVIARAVDVWWADHGWPDPFFVVDMGAGPGTLTRSVLAARPEVSRCGALRWIAVEQSDAQRALHPESPFVTSAAVAPEPDGPTIVVANELLDNLPFDVAERVSDGWVELRVDLTERSGVDGPIPSFVLAPGPRLAEDGGLPDLAVGARVPVETEARRFVADTLAALPAGRLVVIDYGASTGELAGRRDMGWLRVHRDHGGGGSWLVDPGSCDITVDVAFDQIGADRPPRQMTSQADFLRRHGIAELVAEGRRVWTERAHLGDLEALRARSRVVEAEALLEPGGMGDFVVAEWVV